MSKKLLGEVLFLVEELARGYNNFSLKFTESVNMNKVLTIIQIMMLIFFFPELIFIIKILFKF